MASNDDTAASFFSPQIDSQQTAAWLYLPFRAETEVLRHHLVDALCLSLFQTSA